MKAELVNRQINAAALAFLRTCVRGEGDSDTAELAIDQTIAAAGIGDGLTTPETRDDNEKELKIITDLIRSYRASAEAKRAKKEE